LLGQILINIILNYVYLYDSIITARGHWLTRSDN